MPRDQCEILEEYKHRRLAHEPVSKILGERHFWKYSFNISHEALDPRADSEVLIEAALHWAPHARDILDCGTGTGCLLLSLLLELPEAQGVGIDISPEAIKVASSNVDKLGLITRTELYPQSWEDYAPSRRFDLVISNPPYIAETEKPDLSKDVTLYDPALALFGGQDGLDAYRSLARALPSLLKPEGVVILEIGYLQAESVNEIMEKAGFSRLELRQDLGGHDRALIFHLK